MTPPALGLLAGGHNRKDETTMQTQPPRDAIPSAAERIARDPRSSGPPPPDASELLSRLWHAVKSCDPGILLIHPELLDVMCEVREFLAED